MLANFLFRFLLNRCVSRSRRKAELHHDVEKAELCARKGTLEAWARHKTPRHLASELEGEEDHTHWSGALRPQYAAIYTDGPPMVRTWKSVLKQRFSQETERLQFTVSNIRTR